MEGKKISEISFESFFPKEYDESYCRYYSNATPFDYLAKLNTWVDADNPFRLIIDDLHINELVNISKFTPDIRAGEVGDIYYNITFRTHQDLVITTVNDEDSSYQGGLVDYNNRYFGNDEYSDGDTIKIVIQATVYEENSQNSTGLGYAYVGETYTVYSQWGEWVQLYYGTSGGWVHCGFITKV